MVFHSWRESLCSLFTHEIWRLVNLFRISTCFRPPSLKLLQIVLCFVLVLVLFDKKEFFIVSKALIMWLGAVTVRTWKTIFGIAKNLKTTILPWSVRF